MPYTARNATSLVLGLLLLHPIGLLAQEVLTPTDSLTQGMAPTLVDGRQIYAAHQFQRFAPQTAADMVQQIPGFSISNVSGDRGLGDATQNVLINSQRITGKENDAESALARIAVGSVVHLEILEGAKLDIPGLNGQVLNVVTRQERSRGNFVWRPQVRPNIPDHWINAEINYSGQIGAGSYTLGISNGGFRGGGQGNEIISSALGQPTSIRDRDFVVWNDQPRLSASYGVATRSGSRFNVNATLSEFGFRNRMLTTYALDDSTGVLETRRNRNRNRNVELGSDFDMALAFGRLKLVGLFRNQYNINRNQFERDTDDALPTTGQRFERDADSGERVARSEYRWKSGGGDWQVSGEAALNFLDAASTLFIRDSSGSYQPFAIAGGTSRVEEKRGQVILSYARPLHSSLSLQSTFGAEYSRLSQSGVGGLTRSFYRPKGSLSLAWKATPRLDMNFRLQRRVGQLNFGDFIASVDVQNNNNNASNPTLVPPQIWAVEMEANRSFGSIGSVQVKLTGESISDVVDQVPINATEEAPGNVPSASRLRATLGAGLLLDGLGITGGKIDFNINKQRTRVKDPLLGTHRSLSNERELFWNVEFRQDVPATPWVWGLQSDYEAPEKTYRLDFYSRNFRNRPQLVAFLEHKNVLGMKVRFHVQNLLDRRERQFDTYYVDRRDGPVDFLQSRSVRFGPIFRLQVSGAF